MVPTGTNTAELRLRHQTEIDDIGREYDARRRKLQTQWYDLAIDDESGRETLRHERNELQLNYADKRVEVLERQLRELSDAEASGGFVSHEDYLVIRASIKHYRRVISDCACRLYGDRP